MIEQHLNSLKRVLAYRKSPYPTKYLLLAATSSDDDVDDDITVVTSNTTLAPDHVALGMMVNPAHAIADTGTTSIFLTKGAPCLNKRRTLSPISVTLTDGRKIVSSHICDVCIPGLPAILTGHIMPDMTTASLFGIRILCKAGCKVVFDNEKCHVFYDNKLFYLVLKTWSATCGRFQFSPTTRIEPPMALRATCHPAPCLMTPRAKSRRSRIIVRRKRTTESSCTKVCAIRLSRHSSLPYAAVSFVVLRTST